jgi:hypothetical protein
MPTSTLIQANLAQANRANYVAIADYEILVEVKEVSEEVYEVIPHMPPDPLHFGKTVHYRSDDGHGNYVGKVEIEFPNHSPYLKHNGSEIKKVTSNDPPLELKVRGNFIGHCFVWKDGVRLGWGLADPNAGGNHVVQ